MTVPTPRFEDDPDHTRGLEELTHAVRYRRFMFDLLEPHCGASVLEVGAGHGDFAAHFPAGRRLILTDTDEACLAELKERFAGRDEVSVRHLDLNDDVPVEQTVDSAIAINVLEHIEDDVGALRRMASAVKPGGNVLLYVPAYMSLYGEFDRAVGHVRRYTPATLRRTVEQAGLQPVVLRPVNLLGGIAWWLAVRLGGQVHPRPSLVKLYDLLVVPVVRVMERWIRVPFGKSLLCVARRV